MITLELWRPGRFLRQFLAADAIRKRCRTRRRHSALQVHHLNGRDHRAVAGSHEQFLQVVVAADASGIGGACAGAACQGTISTGRLARCSNRCETLPNGRCGRSVRLLEPSTMIRASCSSATARMALATCPTWAEPMTPSTVIAPRGVHAQQNCLVHRSPPKVFDLMSMLGRMRHRSGADGDRVRSGWPAAVYLTALVTGSGRFALVLGGRSGWILAGQSGRYNGNPPGQMSRAIGADRAVHDPFHAMAWRGAHNQHVAAGRGELSQYRAWIAFRSLDGHVNVARDATDGGTECLLDEPRGRLLRHGSPKGQDHVPAAVAMTAQATVLRQAKRPYPYGHQWRIRRPGKPDRPAQCGQATR